jgi:hypothetical protein
MSDKCELIVAEDTENIFIPSVFVSRASYLLLRDVLVRHKESHRDGSGPWIDLGEGEQEGGYALVHHDTLY